MSDRSGGMTEKWAEERKQRQGIGMPFPASSLWVPAYSISKCVEVFFSLLSIAAMFQINSKDSVDCVVCSNL